MDEVWNDIQHVCGSYQISSFGRIRNKKTGRILKLRPSHRGYLKTNISIGGRLKTVFPHRLVAENFIPNPNNLPQVNHKDGNKENNHLDNLEWCSDTENMRHAFATGLNKGKRIPVYQKDENGNIIKYYPSMRHAENALGCSSHCSCIWKVCNGERKTHKGFHWSY